MSQKFQFVKKILGMVYTLTQNLPTFGLLDHKLSKNFGNIFFRIKMATFFLGLATFFLGLATFFLGLATFILGMATFFLGF